MAEKSLLWTAPNGVGDGATSYTELEWAIHDEIVAACGGSQGVAPGYLNGLAVTTPSVDNIYVASGGAIVDGKVYYNTTTVSKTLTPRPSPGYTRIDRIALRCDWTAKTVRVVVITGTPSTGTPAVPGLAVGTRSVYEIALAQALYTATGTITITDERAWGVMRINAYRQGGSSTNWATRGVGNYHAPGILQCGGIAIKSILEGGQTVQFPVPFTAIPIILASSDGGQIIAVYNATTTNFVIGCEGSYNAASTMWWIAIGPG